MSAVTMIVSAVAIILFVRYGLLTGIHQVAGALNWSAKARGQLTGYATSVPEFVCLVSAGVAGVWEAGLWNIVSSNIINTSLMLMAVFYYRQVKELANRRFVDELLFAGLAIAMPIVLMQFQVDTRWFLVPGLLAFFGVYLFIDRKVNKASPDEKSDAHKSSGSLLLGIILCVASLAAIATAGSFLGRATADVIAQLSVPAAIAGWILGVVTSIPEMVSFFSVYGTAKKQGGLDRSDDTQEVLDNLTGSNMANVGFVYPLGLAAFLLATSL